jgi:hypothetical protein
MSDKRTLEEQCYGECWAAKERIEELNASLAEAWLTNATLRADLARATAERDEARRLYCHAQARIPDGREEQLAQTLGWDCFKEVQR